MLLATKDGVIVGPSETKAPSDCDVMDTVFSARLSQCQTLAVHRQPSVAAFVIGLSLYVRPTAILRAVWAAVVDSVQRVSFWARTHIAQELAEVSQPFRTHPNSSTAVILKTNRARICAALFGGYPSHPFARACLPVLQVTEPSPTTTTLNTSVQHVGANGFCFTAGATTQPSRVVVSAEGSLYDSKVAELLSGQVVQHAVTIPTLKLNG